MTDEPGIYPCDEPMATIQRTFNEDAILPDWEELSPPTKQKILENCLRDTTLAELVEIRKRLQHVYRKHETPETLDDLLAPTIQSVRSMIQLWIQQTPTVEAIDDKSYV